MFARSSKFALLAAALLAVSNAPAQSLGTTLGGVTAPVTSTLGVTNIAVGTSVTRTGMKRVGMNIDGQNFYDSGQIMKNLVFRNPGFEGETWQTILHCVSLSGNTCTDGNQYAQWPAAFMAGGTFEVLTGSATGATGSIVTSTAASGNNGVSIQSQQFPAALAAGDWIVVRQSIPGNGIAGWNISTWAGGTVTSETTDLSPNTAGKQALLLNASTTGQSAGIDGYFDSTNTHNYVLINGTYQITFRAKGMGGNNLLNVSFGRLSTGTNYINQTLTLTPNWQDYTLTFSAAETSSTAIGTLDLHFSAGTGSALLDDVSLALTSGSSSNPTAFRDEVVTALTALHPGTLRYMDGMTDFGSTVDNMIAPVGARLRTGSSTQSSEIDDIPMGLHEFLVLCQTVGADPWFNLPPAISTTEMQNLMQYFAGDASTPYGAKRAALGQTAPWTSVFTTIHLELGNEQWNYNTFPGNAINDPAAYGQRVGTVYTAAKNSPSYDAKKFDLIMGSFVSNAWWTQQEAANATNYDSISVAPYLFNTFSDSSSNEAIFAPMFAEPELWDSTSNGIMVQQAQAAQAAGKKLVVYEENLSTLSGTALQSYVNSTVPSVSGGIALADHMLLQMRDLGIQTQNVWAISGSYNSFNNSNGQSETTPLFGTTIDMGGQANRKRPAYLAEQVVNTAVLSNMLGTTITGSNPTWNQPWSINDGVYLNGAHYLQTFAFTDGAKQRSVVVVNLSRSTAYPVTFSGTNAPSGSVTISQLTSANLTDTNETSDVVEPTTKTNSAFLPSVAQVLPPFSVTVFTWTTN